MSVQRLKHDFPFALVIGLGVVSTAGILPLAVMRFLRGQPVHGTLDLAIIVGILGLTAHVWRGGNVLAASRIATVIISIGAAAIAWLDMRDGMMWIYTVIVANFLLSSPRWALGVSLAMVIAVMVRPGAFDGSFGMTTYLTTATMVAVFAFVFGHRSEVQRRALQRLAEQDPLTGLGNRRGLDRQMETLLQTAARQHVPCGLVLLDLDHFKRINDSHGHEQGDYVLCQLAQSVQRHARNGDQLFRLGGEEFVLLQLGVDRRALAERVHQLQGHLREELRCQGEPVTVSIGAAHWQPGDDAASWLARADRAMYQAKRDGRDRAVIDGELAAA